MAAALSEMPHNNNSIAKLSPANLLNGTAGDDGDIRATFSHGSDTDSLKSTDSGNQTEFISNVDLKRQSPRILSDGHKISVSNCIHVGFFSSEEELLSEEGQRRRSASVIEVTEHAHARLRDELLNAQKELKLKDEECKKLSHVQDQMGKELEDLTASLFEEANKMVIDANVKRMSAEKLHQEAKAKIEVLQAEVSALKELVITSTPSMPNKHLHPQIALKNGKKVGVVSNFVKGHRRSTSHHNFMQAVQMSTPDVKPLPVKDILPTTEDKPVDPTCFMEFQLWKDSPSLDIKTPFLSRIVTEDVLPCIGFSNEELSRSVYDSIMKNTLAVEPVQGLEPRNCSLMNKSSVCRHRIRACDFEPWHYVSQLARNRITAVCDFFSYVRYITQGLVKTRDNDMYWEIVKHRKQMNLAKLGLS